MIMTLAQKKVNFQKKNIEKKEVKLEHKEIGDPWTGI